MLWRVGTRGDFGLDLGGGGDEIVFVTRKGKKKDHGRYEKKKPNNEEIFATYSCSKTIVDVG